MSTFKKQFTLIILLLVTLPSICKSQHSTRIGNYKQAMKYIKRYIQKDTSLKGNKGRKLIFATSTSLIYLQFRSMFNSSNVEKISKDSAKGVVEKITAEANRNDTIKYYSKLKGMNSKHTPDFIVFFSSQYKNYIYAEVLYNHFHTKLMYDFNLMFYNNYQGPVYSFLFVFSKKNKLINVDNGLINVQ